MTIDLDAIRARDKNIDSGVELLIPFSNAEADRRALLAYVDELRAAAGKVLGLWLDDANPAECEMVVADLRALLKEAGHE